MMSQSSQVLSRKNTAESIAEPQPCAPPDSSRLLALGMREHIDRLLAQTSLVTLALGVAIGWSLFQVAKGVADLVEGLLTKYPSGSQVLAFQNAQAATWIVGRRVLTFTTLITGAVELAVVLVVSALIARRKTV